MRDSFICFMKSCLSALSQEYEFDSPSMSLSFLAAVLYLRLESNCFHLKDSFWKSLKGFGSPGPIYSPMSVLFHCRIILSSFFIYFDWNALFLNMCNLSSSFDSFCSFFWNLFVFWYISFPLEEIAVYGLLLMFSGLLICLGFHFQKKYKREVLISCFIVIFFSSSRESRTIDYKKNHNIFSKRQI